MSVSEHIKVYLVTARTRSTMRMAPQRTAHFLKLLPTHTSVRVLSGKNQFKYPTKSLILTSDRVSNLNVGTNYFRQLVKTRKCNQ